jgi:hypothetical protein
MGFVPRQEPEPVDLPADRIPQLHAGELVKVGYGTVGEETILPDSQVAADPIEQRVFPFSGKRVAKPVPCFGLIRDDLLTGEHRNGSQRPAPLASPAAPKTTLAQPKNHEPGAHPNHRVKLSLHTPEFHQSELHQSEFHLCG